MFNFEISQTTEDIDRVYFVVDGRVEEVKENGPFAFALIPDEPKDHSVYALVRDKAGNLNASEEISFSSERFVGGGVSMNLKVENGLEVESNSNILLSADVSSEFGVAEIDSFSMENPWVWSNPCLRLITILLSTRLILETLPWVDITYLQLQRISRATRQVLLIA